MTKIFIDPGHGGNDPGAVGNGLREKDLTLDISKRIEDLLKKYSGVQVRLSRTTDKTLSLNQRTDLANRWGADYLLSVHINAGGGTGFESYIYNGGVSAKTGQAQNDIHGAIIDAIDVRNRGEKRANFHMLRESNMPALLTENLFIDRKEDADNLKDNVFLDRVAQGHVNGLVKVFGLKKKSTKTASKSASKTTSENTYIVKPGDTLSAIARRYKTTVSELAKINNIDKPDLIRVGQRIKLPGSSSAGSGSTSRVAKPVLRRGMKNSEVKILQQNLTDHRPQFNPRGIDGSYGPLTEDAVLRYQKYYGVKPYDGIYGPKTAAKLKETLYDS